MIKLLITYGGMIKLVIEGLGLVWMGKTYHNHKLQLTATEDWQLSGFYFCSHRGKACECASGTLDRF
jgi:hypothetical protein